MSNLKQLINAARNDLRVTPRLTAWLSKGEELVLSPATAAFVAEQTMTVPRIRSGSFSSSSRGSCTRQQVLDYLGYPVTDDKPVDTRLRAIFSDGHWRHLRWQALLLEIGVLTHAESKWVLPGYRLQGSVDGINATEKWGFELKGANSNSFRQVVKSGPMRNHLMQIHTYMLGTGLTEFSLIYECKDTQDFVEFRVEMSSDVGDSVLQELGELNVAVDLKKLPPVLAECSTTPNPRCKYATVCHGARWTKP